MSSQNNHRTSRTSPRRARRAGAALLMTIFMIGVTSLLVVSMLATLTSQFAAVRNAADYERALYLAGAAVHHALVQLEEDYGWRGTLTEGAYPADDTYSATVAEGAEGTVLVTGTGVAGEITRRLQITVTEGE